MKLKHEITIVDIFVILAIVAVVLIFTVSMFTQGSSPQETQQFFSTPLHDLQFRHVVLLLVLWWLFRKEK
jgi:hypothetical protein